MAERRPHQLTISVQGKSTSVEVDKDVFTVGRTSGSDVVIGADVVSKKHLEFTVRNGRASVRDLGSRNGTHLDGLALQPGIAYPVQPGSEIRIGDDSVLIHVHPAHAADIPPKADRHDLDLDLDLDGGTEAPPFQTTVQAHEVAAAPVAPSRAQPPEPSQIMLAARERATARREVTRHEPKRHDPPQALERAPNRAPERSSDRGPEAARTRRRLDETEDKLVRLLASLSIAEDELKRVRREFAKETEQIEAKRQALAAEKETVAQMATELDRRDAELGAREDEFRRRQETVNAELAEAQDRAARLDEEADQALAECERARAEVHRAHEVHESLERDREEARQRHDTEITEYEARGGKLRAQLENLEAEAHTARIRTEGETEKLAALKRANEEEMRLHELKLQKQALDSSMAVTRAEQALTAIVDRTQASIHDSERAKAALDECRLEKSKVDEQLRSLRAATEAELAAVRDKQRSELAHAAAAQARELFDTRRQTETELTQMRRQVETELAEARRKTESEIAADRLRCDTETSEARSKCEAEIAAHRLRVEAELTEARRKCEVDVSAARAKCEADVSAERAKCEADVSAERAKCEAEVSAAREKCDADVSAARNKIEAEVSAAHAELASAQAELAHTRKTSDDIKNHGTEEIERRILSAKEIEATAKESAARLMEKTRADAAAFAKASSDKLHAELAEQGTRMEADLAARRIEALTEIDRTLDRENRVTETRRRTQAEYIVRRALDLAESPKLAESSSELKAFVTDILQGKMPEVSSIAAEQRTQQFWRKTRIAAACCVAPVLLYLAFPQAPKEISSALRRTIAGNKDDSGAFLEQIRAKGAVYRPQQDRVFRASYADNTLFLEGYVEFKLNEAHQRDWTLALSSFFTKTLGLDDRVVVEFIATETVLVKELARIRESTVEQYKDQGRARMDETEGTEAAKLAAMLKTPENYERFRMFEKSFFESGGAKP